MDAKSRAGKGDEEKENHRGTRANAKCSEAALNFPQLQIETMLRKKWRLVSGIGKKSQQGESKKRDESVVASERSKIGNWKRPFRLHLIKSIKFRGDASSVHHGRGHDAEFAARVEAELACRVAHLRKEKKRRTVEYAHILEELGQIFQDRACMTIGLSFEENMDEGTRFAKEAEKNWLQALGIFSSINSPVDEARVHRLLGDLLEAHIAEYEKAEVHHTQALEILRRIYGDRHHATVDAERDVHRVRLRFFIVEV